MKIITIVPFIVTVTSLILFQYQPVSSQYIRNGSRDTSKPADDVFPYFWGACNANSDPKMLYSFSPGDGFNKWWNRINNNGEIVESGTYWYILIMPAINDTKKGFIFVKLLIDETDTE